MVAYKENAPWHDPLFIDREPGNDHLVTTKWRNPPVNRPEASLMGSMFLEVETPVDGDLVVEDANGWMTQHTELTSGSHLRGVLGYEVDGISAFSPPGTHIVARSSVSGIDGVATLYRATSGAIIFSSGSMQWSWGLDDYNAPQLRTSVVSPAVQQMTKIFSTGLTLRMTAGTSSTVHHLTLLGWHPVRRAFIQSRRQFWMRPCP